MPLCVPPLASSDQALRTQPAARPLHKLPGGGPALVDENPLLVSMCCPAARATLAVPLPAAGQGVAPGRRPPHPGRQRPRLCAPAGRLQGGQVPYGGGAAPRLVVHASPSALVPSVPPRAGLRWLCASCLCFGATSELQAARAPASSSTAAPGPLRSPRSCLHASRCGSLDKFPAQPTSAPPCAALLPGAEQPAGAAAVRPEPRRRRAARAARRGGGRRGGRRGCRVRRGAGETGRGRRERGVAGCMPAVHAGHVADVAVCLQHPHGAQAAGLHRPSAGARCRGCCARPWGTEHQQPPSARRWTCPGVWAPCLAARPGGPRAGHWTTCDGSCKGGWAACCGCWAGGAKVMAAPP